nr:uncharacterized mitochondrial protein AtMg00810-like [Tanacetum cinerariifolium]
HVVPTAVLTRSRLVSLTAARLVSTTVPPTKVQHQRPTKHGVTKAHSPIRRPINLRPSPTHSNFHHKVTIVKATKGNPQHALKDKGVIDSGCSRHMTQNISYISDFEEINRGYVAFGGNPKCGKIIGKGKIRTGKLDFDDVYFVKELKFNLFSVSQMCDKKNSVLFTDTECIVLSFDFKLPDENHMLLRVLRENNMYNVDLKIIVPLGDLTCLFGKAALDESNLWHRRLGHINFKTMNKLVKGIEKQINLKMKIIRSDNGTEFKNQDLNQFCGMKKIKKEFSVARTPQHNRIAERKNITLIEAARTMLADLLLPIPFWAEVVNTACYVQNRVLVTKPYNKTPYKLLLGRTPRFIRPFGCHVTILNTLDPLGNQPNYSAGIQEHFDKPGERNVQQYVLFPLWSSGFKDPYNTNADATFGVKEHESEVHVSPSSSAKTQKHNDKTKREAKGKSPVELSTGVRNLSEEFEDFSDNSINGVNAASTPVTAVGQNLTNNTNTFSVAGHSNTDVSPTLGESSYVDPSQYPDDPDIPALEDITYLDDEEDVGAEADFSNLETNITVSPILTTRVHKDHHVIQIISDLSSAPQTRSMTRMVKEQGRLTQISDEDFHTCMFACFLSQKEPKRVHQALKDPSWIEATQEELFQFKMQKEEGIDYEEVFAPVARIEAIRLSLAYASFMGFMVYQMDVKRAFLYGTIEEEIYVDDIIFGSTNKYLCKTFKKLMKDKFQMSSMGELTFFRLQVKQKQDGIFISQDKYVAKILRKFGLTDRKSASSPTDTEKPLLKDLDGKDVDVHSYRSMIGSLMYLTSSRPDIMFAVCACARFQVTPKASHLHAVKRNFRYLKGKPHLGLWYPKDSPFNLVAYFDSDYAGASLDRKPITGGCQFLGCRLISWQYKKQTVVATSSTEAEYVVAASCGVNTPRCDEDGLEIMELMTIINVVSSKLMLFGLTIDAVHLLLLGHKVSAVGVPTIIMVLTFADTHNMIAFLTKLDASEGFEQIIDFLNTSVIQYALTVNFTIYVSCIKQFWSSVSLKKTNDVVRLQALIDRRKVIITEDTVRQTLRLNDANSIDYLPNEEIFAVLARMGYKKSSTKLTFYKAFFSAQWKFLIHTILQYMSSKRTA